MAYGIIYLIWNMLNGKKYVGQTTKNLNYRISQHMKKKNSIVGAAMKKYGLENFHYGVVETCNTQEQLNERERYYIAVLNCKAPYGYNRTDGGEGTTGYSPTKEAREKLREANLGKKLSKEHCAKISAKNRGKKRTPEQCANISAGKMGHEVTKGAREKLRAANLGKKASLETTLKMSEKRRGKTPYKNLLNEMIQRQLTYKAFGELIGASQTSIGGKMRGERVFTEENITKMVAFFGLPAEYLMECAEN